MKMGTSESEIAEEILGVLSRRQPCRATVISRLLNEQGKNSVNKRVVNRLLYGVLRKEVEQDAEYRWSLRQSIYETPEKLHCNESSLVTPDFENHSSLRTIQRLRSGLPPVEGLRRLTVGYENVFPKIDKILNPSKRRSRWMLVKGDYGDGKSHFLQVFRSRAHEAGYASCYLCSDAGNNALNHPQRFLHSLLTTMEFPKDPLLGIEYTVSNTALTPEGRNQLRGLCHHRGLPSRMPFRQVIEDLDFLDRCETRHAAAGLMHQGRFRVAEELSGSTISHRSANESSRDVAYRLLRIAIDLAVEQGYRGVAFLIDEAESIFTKLWNSASRSGAFRVLSALCEGPLFDDCVFAVAVTPDAYRDMLFEVRPLPSHQRLHEERMKAFAQNIKKENVPTIDCPRLSDGQRPALLDSVKHLYQEAYQGWQMDPSGAWSEFTAQLLQQELPIRIAIRQAIDFLDTQRFIARG